MKKPYTTEEWAKWQAAYESGKFASIEALHNHYSNLKEKIPSIPSLKIRCSKDRWDKGLHKEELLEAQASKFIRLAGEMGFGEKQLVEELVRCIQNPYSEYKSIGIKHFLDITGFRAPTKIAKTDGEGTDVENDTIFIIPANGFEPRE